MLSGPLILLISGGGLALGAAAAVILPGLLRSRDPRLLRAVAGCAALAGAASSASPTGLESFDLVVRALVAAAVVLVSTRARPWAVAASGVAVAGVAAIFGGPPEAFAAAGAALAHVLTARRGRFMAAVVVAATVSAAFRLGGPPWLGGPTVAAAVALSPVMLSGIVRMRRPHRRRVLLAVVGIGVAAGVCSLPAALAALLSEQSLRRGIAAAEGGIGAARSGDQQGATALLSLAAGEFADADATLSAWWTFPSRVVPVVGQHLASLATVAATGRELASTGAETVDAADLGGLRVRSGSVDVVKLSGLESSLGAASATVLEARTRLDRVRSPWLVGPVAEPLEEQLDRLRNTEAEIGLAREAVRVLPGLLGADESRRYFLAVQTPSELRGAGGIIGSYGVLGADGGRVEVLEFGSNADLNEGGHPSSRVLRAPADYVARHAKNRPERIWQNVTLAPDFPTVAGVIADLYPQSGGQAVDGVFSMDPTALAAVLRLTGPIDVAPWPVPISAENAESILLFEQYVTLAGDPRKEFLGDVAEAVARKFTSVDLPPPRTIVDTLAPVVAGHHLMLTSTRPEEQAFLERVGATGALPDPRTGDSLAVVSQNAGGNKLDWFLRRSTSYDVRLSETGILKATVRVEMRNEAPSTGLPDFIIGSLAVPPDPRGFNRQYLSVYSPWPALGATIDGRPVAFEAERETARNVYSVFLAVPPGGAVTVEFALRGSLPSTAEYQLAVHRQPLVVPEDLTVTVDGEVWRPPSPLIRDASVTRTVPGARR